MCCNKNWKSDLCLRIVGGSTSISDIRMSLIDRNNSSIKNGMLNFMKGTIVLGKLKVTLELDCKVGKVKMDLGTY
jgi:hypothetical protein